MDESTTGAPVIQIPVSDIPCGSVILIGKYSSINLQVEYQPPIEWLKVSRDCEFITRHVIDLLLYDAEEPRNVLQRASSYMGSSDNRVSNMFSFLNSDESYWYEPMHEYDTPPDTNRYGRSSYEDHPGFLHFFEDYEKASISGVINLPSSEWFFGENRKTYFRKHGSRATLSEDALLHKQFMGDYKETSCVPFFLSDMQNPYVNVLGRDKRVKTTYPKAVSGMRPACKIKPETVVRKCGDAAYTIVPFAVEHTAGPSDSALFELLGITTR